MACKRSSVRSRSGPPNYMFQEISRHLAKNGNNWSARAMARMVEPVSFDNVVANEHFCYKTKKLLS